MKRQVSTYVQRTSASSKSATVDKSAAVNKQPAGVWTSETRVSSRKGTELRWFDQNSAASYGFNYRRGQNYF